MSTSRAESQQSQYGGRRRSNTAQSMLRPNPPAPLKFGDSKVLNSWVHGTKESSAVIFNQSWWPGVAEGDLMRVKGCDSEDSSFAFLFTVPKDDGCPKQQLQVCPSVYIQFHLQLSIITSSDFDPEVDRGRISPAEQF